MKRIPTQDTLTMIDTAAFVGMSEKKYRSADGLSRSLFVEFMRSPMHYIDKLNNPIKASENMDIGTALHAEMLRDEPSEVYATCRKLDLRKNADKDYLAKFKEDNEGKIIIDEDAKKMVDGMKESLLSNPYFIRLHEGATHKELALFGTRRCQHGDVRMKAMLDGYCENHGIIYDIKTTQSAHVDKFKWSMRDFRYDVQQVWYSNMLMGCGFNMTKFVFVAIESKPPFGVSYHTLSLEQYRRAFDEFVNQTDFFSKCQATQDFNVGYPQAINEITF